MLPDCHCCRSLKERGWRFRELWHWRKISMLFGAWIALASASLSRSICPSQERLFASRIKQISSRISGMASSWFGIKPLRGFFPTSAGHHRRWSKSAFCWRRCRFLWYGVAYESELSTRRRITKIAQPSVARFALFVIRLGFEKLQWNTKEYSILLLWFTFYKWLIYK